MLEPIMLQNLASIASGSIASWISYAPEAVLVGIGAGAYFVLSKKQSISKEAKDRIEFEKIRMGYYNNPQQMNPQQNTQQPQNAQPAQNNAQGNSMNPQENSQANGMVSYFAMQKITELAKKRKMSNTQMLDEIVITYLTSQTQRNPQRQQPPQQGGGNQPKQQNAFAGLEKMSNDLLTGKSTII